MLIEILILRLGSAFIQAIERGKSPLYKYKKLTFNTSQKILVFDVYESCIITYLFKFVGLAPFQLTVTLINMIVNSYLREKIQLKYVYKSRSS